MSNTNITPNVSFCVYKHTNKINNKVYIGITSRKNPKTRWRNQGQGYKSHLHFYSAIKKYGWDNFTHEIIISNLSELEAKKLEEKLISQYDSTNPEKGYNIMPSSIDQNVTIRQRNGMFNIGKNHPMYGKHRTPEEREKISKNHKDVSGKNNPMYGVHRFKEKSPCYGKHWKLSEDAKKRISEGHKGLKLFNNGVIQVRRKECPQGFIPGRIPKK